jgi:hypothetical protein
MNYLKISNKGLLDVEALTLLGASSKRGDNTKIGMFGSGNKFSLAYLLRNNYNIKIFSGLKEIILTTTEKVFRDKKFNIILVDGKETSITTDFGKDWNLAQSIRELYCNSIDEGEHTMEFVKDICPQENVTSFYIKNQQEITNYISEFDNYFSENKKVLFECPYGKILEKGKETLNFYRKGIRCLETNKKSVYDYDITNVSINESRLVQYNWQVPSLIWELIYQCTNKEIIMNVLMNCSDSNFIECIPSDFSNVNNALMSKEYKECLKDVEIAPRAMAGLLSIEEQAKAVILPDTIYKHALSFLDNNNICSKFKVYKNNFYVEIPLSKIHQNSLEKAFDFFIECNYKDVINYDITIARFEKKDILGLADCQNQKIILSEICMDSGIQTIIETLIEEYIHLKYEVKDETRGFQDAAIKELVKILKINNAYLI